MAAFTVIAGVLGSIALFEGLQALLESFVGDPEADVSLALQRLAANNRQRVVTRLAIEQAGKEDLDTRFAEFNEIPRRALAQDAFDNLPGPALGERDTGVLDFVSQGLNVSPRGLERASSPSQLGDLSEVFRRVGQQPPGEG